MWLLRTHHELAGQRLVGSVHDAPGRVVPAAREDHIARTVADLDTQPESAAGKSRRQLVPRQVLDPQAPRPVVTAAGGGRQLEARRARRELLPHGRDEAIEGGIGGARTQRRTLIAQDGRHQRVAPEET